MNEYEQRAKECLAFFLHMQKEGYQLLAESKTTECSDYCKGALSVFDNAILSIRGFLDTNIPFKSPKEEIHHFFFSFQKENKKLQKFTRMALKTTDSDFIRGKDRAHRDIHEAISILLRTAFWWNDLYKSQSSTTGGP